MHRGRPPTTQRRNLHRSCTEEKRREEKRGKGEEVVAKVARHRGSCECGLRGPRAQRWTDIQGKSNERRGEGGGLWRMEKGGPFIDVVCRTRYIGRDCRSIEPWRRCFRGTDFVLARFEDPSSPWVRNILSSFEEENVSSKDYTLMRRLLDLWIWFLFYIYTYN